MGETNKLKYNLLQQYLDGQLDPKRMHELEKEALEDPFLAEALDGYAVIKGSMQPHLSILQRQLEDRVAQSYVKKNTMFFTWQRLSVAAAASLLFVSASILFWMKGSDRSVKVAVNPKQTEVKLTATDRLGKEKSPNTVSDEEQLVAATVPHKAVQSRSLPSTNSEVKSAGRSFPSPAPVSGSSTNTKVQAADANAALSKESFARVPAEKEEMQIAANNGTASSSIVLNDELKSTSSRKSNLSRSAGVQSVVTEPSNSLNEVVAAGYVNKLRLAQPAGGWKSYRDYLIKNQSTTLKTVTSDSVTVLFQVDVKGNPINLRIEKGIDQLHDQEAIRLIKQGPLWQSSTGEGLLQGRVVVPF